MYVCIVDADMDDILQLSKLSFDCKTSGVICYHYACISLPVLYSVICKNRIVNVL